MKREVLLTVVFIAVSVCSVSARTSSKTGTSAVSARLVIGSNSEDSIAQVSVDYEYGIISHLSAGVGYVYVDGIDPVQANGFNLFLTGYLLDSSLDVYARTGVQIYDQDGLDFVSTFLAGVQWQSPFKFFAAFEGGAELEGSDLGYLAGIVLGARF